MSIIVDRATRLCVSGITGREGTFHSLNNRAYGTNVVSGVTPGKGGQDVEGIPVFNTFHDAVAQTQANTAMIFVPPPFAADSILEAAEAGITTIIAITEGIPAHDELRVYTHLRRTPSVRLIGPNCPGVLSPGKANVGIIPAAFFSEGNIGVVSRSGTLTYQVGNELAQRGFGNSSIVGIGGDPVPGSSFVEVIDLFEADPETELIVMSGEIGGDAEEVAAAHIAEHISKPVVAYIAGFTAPPGKTMGHAGAIVSGSKGTAAAKARGAGGGRRAGGAGPRPRSPRSQWKSWEAEVMSDAALSFARGAPSLDIVDVEGLSAAAQRAFANDPGGMTAYGTAVGYVPLRRWIAERHGVEESNVLVTNGSMQADAFLFDELVGAGDAVVVERPSYDRTLLSLRQHGAALTAIPLEPDGIDTDALAEALANGARPKLAHIIPNFHNPAGYTLSGPKRERLLELAREHEFTIFEDDPYVALRFRGETLPTMLSLDAGAGNVVYASSFSKTVCPGIRVGFLIGARRADRANRRARHQHLHLAEHGRRRDRLRVLRVGLDRALDRARARRPRGARRHARAGASRADSRGLLRRSRRRLLPLGEAARRPRSGGRAGGCRRTQAGAGER